MSDDALLPAPTELGLPEKFQSWRRDQDRSIIDGLHSEKRFVVHAAPTGAGKSLIGVATHILSDERTAMLTSTKNLQDQLNEDFKSIGLTDMKGASNYRCLDSPDPKTTCDDGHCHFGLPCDLQQRGCLYYDQRRVAARSPLVVTNYSYWLYSHEYGEGLGKRDCLVADEAHAAVSELLDFLRVEITQRECERLGMAAWPADDPDSWMRWWDKALRNAKRIEEGGGPKWKIKEARSSIKRMERLIEADAAREWVREDNLPWSRAWEPLWPKKYAEAALFRGIPRVLLTSATIRPKALELLGLSPSQYDFIEHDSNFALARRPVYYFNTDSPIRLDNRTSRADFDRWTLRMDEIIGPRIQRKGIIHSVSYARAEEIRQRSQWGAYMLTHERKNAAETIASFKQMKAPAILVSPAVSTGIDFPGTECEWAIISKVPFPDQRSTLMRARSKEDKTYPYYVALTELVQSAGRGMRSRDDSCETFIVDEHFVWLSHQQRGMLPLWFRDALRSISVVPNPLPALTNQNG